MEEPHARHGRDFKNRKLYVEAAACRLGEPLYHGFQSGPLFSSRISVPDPSPEQAEVSGSHPAEGFELHGQYHLGYGRVCEVGQVYRP
jgi:hypothetical protein